MRRWLRRCSNDAMWWRAKFQAERASHAATRASLEQATAAHRAAAKVELSDEELTALSEAELDERAKGMERGLERIKGEVKLRMHREMERMRIERDQTLCMACCDKEKSILLTPCNHICVCEACSYQLEKCPICMSPIESRVKVFL